MSDELARVKRIGKAPGSDRVGVPVLQLLRKAEERLAVLHELLDHFDNVELLADAHLRAQNAELLAALRVCMEAIDAAHADPEAGLPSPAWHWWKAARDAITSATQGSAA